VTDPLRPDRTRDPQPPQQRGRALERAAFARKRTGRYDMAALARAMTALLGDAVRYPRDDIRTWVPIGPSVVRSGDPWDFRRTSGRVRDLAVSEDGRRAYAAGKGGLWYTDDGAATWTPVGGWAGREGVRGELTVTQAGRRLSWGLFSLSSTPARATLRKALEAQSTPAEWRAFITEQVAAEVSALPPAPAGKDGAKGDVGERGPEGVQGLPGRDGRDGVNGEKGERGDSGLAGKDGMNGRDGTLEHLKAVFDGERTVTLCFKDTGTPIDGGVIKFVGVVLYRGIWEEGKAYEAGDQVTWGGSSWTAKEDTSAKPGLSTPESRAWVMSVRRGSDGREGKPGPPGPQGMQGVKGIDGRHYSGG